jgi:peptidoglycan/xylan/chitin deacetylase (PgdA/CDA1 family)
VYGFVNGRQLRDTPAHEVILNAWSETRFLFGNHTFSHLDLARVGSAEFIADIERNESVLARWSSPGTRKYFRYPYLGEGDTRSKRDAVRQWLSSRHYTIAQVTVAPHDWAWAEPYARCVTVGDRGAVAWMRNAFMKSATAHLAWAREVSLRVFGRQVKHILLLHVGAFDALVLHEWLSAYRAAGVRLISLDAVVQDPIYRINPDLTWTGRRTFLRQVAEARGIRIPAAPPAPPELDHLCR